MKTYIHISMLLFAGILLAACSPSRTGIVNGTLTTNVRPAIGISVNAPFALADSGRAWSQPTTNMMTDVAAASFDYAVYTEKGVSPDTRLAYAAIIRLEDKERWMFMPQGAKLPGAFGSVRPGPLKGRDGDVQTLRIVREGDWASDLLVANGTKTPETWLAKRWVYALDTDTRAIAEYREPWPAGLEAPDTDIMHLRDKDAEYIRAFEQRALEVFSFTAELGDFNETTRAPGSWTAPRKAPDVAVLAGEVMYIENSDSDSGSGAYN